MPTTTHARSDRQLARSDALVFFGAAGDFAFKQVFPALAGMINDSDWGLPIMGIARHSDVWRFRDLAAQGLEARGITRAAVRHAALGLHGEGAVTYENS